MNFAGSPQDKNQLIMLSFSYLSYSWLSSLSVCPSAYLYSNSYNLFAHLQRNLSICLNFICFLSVLSLLVSCLFIRWYSRLSLLWVFEWWNGEKDFHFLLLSRLPSYWSDILKNDASSRKIKVYVKTIWIIYIFCKKNYLFLAMNKCIRPIIVSTVKNQFGGCDFFVSLMFFLRQRMKNLKNCYILPPPPTLTISEKTKAVGPFATIRDLSVTKPKFSEFISIDTFISLI